MVTPPANPEGERLPRAPRLELRSEMLAKLRAQAAAAYPEEACGALLGRKRQSDSIVVKDLVAVPNARDSERTRRYLIGPEHVVGLERAAGALGLDVVGYYHSHPDAAAVPSEFDRDHAWPFYIYVIVGVRSGDAAKVQAWRLLEDRRGFEPVLIVDEDEID